MLVILRRLSAGAFLFILLPAKPLTLHKDHESLLQTSSVLRQGTARRLPVVLLGMASSSQSNTSINLSLMTFWHSNQFIRCSLCTASPAWPGQGARPLCMHNAWGRCSAQYPLTGRHSWCSQTACSYKPCSQWSTPMPSETFLCACSLLCWGSWSLQREMS